MNLKDYQTGRNDGLALAAKIIKEDGWESHYDKSEGEWEHFCPECRED